MVEVTTELWNKNKIRFIFLYNNWWAFGKDVTNALRYKNSSKAIEQHVHKENKKKLSCKEYSNLYENFWGEYDYTNKTFLNRKGIFQLVSSSRMPNAVQLAHALDMNIYLALNCTKEQQFINDIFHAFKGEKMAYQYLCEPYRIDLYFPEYKIAIECDESGHKDRDQEYEVSRQSYIENELGCQFIRFNPDEEGFNIFNVINRIYKEIIKNEK